MGVIIFHEYRWRKASARARTYFKNESALSDNFFRNFFITFLASALCCFLLTITNPSFFNYCRRKFKIIFPFLSRDKIRKIIRFVFSVKIFFKQNKFQDTKTDDLSYNKKLPQAFYRLRQYGDP